MICHTIDEPSCLAVTVELPLAMLASPPPDPTIASAPSWSDLKQERNFKQVCQLERCVYRTLNLEGPIKGFCATSGVKISQTEEYL